MTIPEGDLLLIHPEGLTSEQEALANILRTTPVTAEVRRRVADGSGGWNIIREMRETFPVDFARKEGDFAFKLHDTNSGAPLSPIRLSLRGLPQELNEQIGVAMAQIPDENPPELCTGIPAAGVPLAQAYATESGILYRPLLDKIDDETGRRIIGTIGHEGTGIVRIVDDLATQGHSKEEAVEAIRAMGYTVSDLTVLVDYGVGAREHLAEHGLQLRAVFTVPQLMHYYLRTGQVNQTQFDAVMTWIGQVHL